MRRVRGGPGRRAVCGTRSPEGRQRAPSAHGLGQTFRDVDTTLLCASVCAGSASLAESLCSCALNSGSGPGCTWRTGRTAMSRGGRDSTNPPAEDPPAPSSDGATCKCAAGWLGSFCWNSSQRARFCLSRSNTNIFSLMHSSRRSWPITSPSKRALPRLATASSDALTSRSEVSPFG